MNAASVAGALQVRSAVTEGLGGSPGDNFYTQGPWTITGTCAASGPAVQAIVELGASSPIFVSINDGTGLRVGAGNPTLIANTLFESAPDTATQGGHFSATLASANFDNHLSGHVVAIADADSSDNSSPFCKFSFEGIGH